MGSTNPNNVISESIHAWRDLEELRRPNEIWLTPFWLRVFIAGLGVVAAVLTPFALAAILWEWVSPGAPGDGIRTIVASVLAVFLSVRVLRFLNPLNQIRWFRFALTSEGLCLPSRGSRLLFVPWPAVVPVDIQRWIGGKGGELSAARLTLDLDEETWPWLKREARVEGVGRTRLISVQIADVTGDEIAARIDAYRDVGPDTHC
jgi:hypothetical protein